MSDYRKVSINILLAIIVTVVFSNVDIYGFIHDEEPIPTISAIPVKPAEVIQNPIPTPPPVQEKLYSESDLTCLATNIYHESRGESLQGQIAVAYVTMNRVKSKRFPDSVCDVVYQAVYSTWWMETHGRLVPVKYRCQFTWYCDGRSDKINHKSSAWHKARLAAIAVLTEDVEDPTNGSTYYFNHHLVDPQWRHQMTLVTIIDNHSFYYHH